MVATEATTGPAAAEQMVCGYCCTTERRPKPDVRPSFAARAPAADPDRYARGRSREGPSSGDSVSAGRQLERPFAFQMSLSRCLASVAALRE